MKKLYYILILFNLVSVLEAFDTTPNWVYYTSTSINNIKSVGIAPITNYSSNIDYKTSVDMALKNIEPELYMYVYNKLCNKYKTYLRYKDIINIIKTASKKVSNIYINKYIIEKKYKNKNNIYVLVKIKTDNISTISEEIFISECKKNNNMWQQIKGKLK